MPMIGGMSCPPIDDAFSIAAAVAGGKPALIMAGMVAVPTVMELAAPLPLTVPIAIEPITADCGIACGERVATRLVTRRSESTHPKPRSRLSTSRNEPMRVSAISGSRENMPVAISTLLAVITRCHERPAW
jgi:hypothetical protein